MTAMLEFRHPLPVVTPLGEGYAVYVTHGGDLENDIWCVVLDDARILHFRSNDLLYVGNATMGMPRPAERPQSELARVTQRMAARAKGDTP